MKEKGNKNKDRKEQKGDSSYSKSGRAKCVYVRFSPIDKLSSRI